MQTGAALISDIDSCNLQEGEIAFWWMGEFGYIVKIGKRVLYLDVFLTDMEGRTTPPLLKPEQVTHADFIFGSHDHGDHIDRPVWPSLANASPQAKFIVPEFLRPGLVEDLNIPESRFIGLDDMESVEVDGLRVTGIAAAHEFLDRDERTGRYPYLGFVIEMDGLTLCHTGDTCKYEGLETRLKKWSYDVVFLPINGRDASRLSAGCLGNMTYQEAVDLAGVLKPRLAVPGHFDMFVINREDPYLFSEYLRVKYPEVKCHVSRHGERVVAPAG